MKNDYDKSFGNWLLNELEDKNLTQADLARLARVSKTSISDVISGRRNPGAKLLIAIANGLNLPYDVVMAAAALIPEGNHELKNFQEWKFILENLPEEERNELLEIARLKLDKSKKIQNKQNARDFQTKPS